jgi:hypothetical protein
MKTPKCGMISLCVALALSSFAIGAHADTQIYLYNSSGTPVLANYCSLQDHQIYDDLSDTVIGTVNGFGQIIDPSNDIIGYVTETDS